MGSLGIKWTVTRAGPCGGVDLGVLLGTSVPIGDTDISIVRLPSPKVRA